MEGAAESPKVAGWLRRVAWPLRRGLPQPSARASPSMAPKFAQPHSKPNRLERPSHPPTSCPLLVRCRDHKRNLLGRSRLRWVARGGDRLREAESPKVAGWLRRVAWPLRRGLPQPSARASPSMAPKFAQPHSKPNRLEMPSHPPTSCPLLVRCRDHKRNLLGRSRLRWVAREEIGYVRPIRIRE